MTARRHQERVAEKHAQTAIGGNRSWLDHQHHARLEHLVEAFTIQMLVEYVRTGSHQVDAMNVDRTGLRAVLAEEPPGGARVLERSVGANGLDHALEAGQNDVVEETPHVCRRLADTHRRADLSGVAAVPGGEL